MRHKKNTIVGEFLERISGTVLEDYRRIIGEMIKGHAGVYALYKSDRLYYVGLARNLMSRVNQHLNDRHKAKWDRFSVYLIADDDHIRPLEALLLRIINPVGNAVRGRLAGAKDLQRPLRKQIKEYQKDQNARLFGDQAVRRRRLAKIKGQRGTLLLNGLLDRRHSLRGWYKGNEYRASLHRNGQIQFKRRLYDSPTGAAKMIIRRNVNGWQFWHYRSPDREWVPLAELKQ